MSILSPTFKECTKTAYKLGSFFGTHPFDWSNRENSPKVSNNKKKLGLWRFNAMLTNLYVLFLAVRCFQVNYSEDSEFSPSIKIYMILISLLYSYTVVHHWSFYHRKDELILLNKQSFRLADQLSGKLYYKKTFPCSILEFFQRKILILVMK